MEEQKSINEKILELRDQALTHKQSYRAVWIGKVSPEMGAKILETCERDVTGFDMYVDSNYIRHIRHRRPKWLENIDKHLLDIIFNAEEFFNSDRNKSKRIVFVRKKKVEFWAIQRIEGKELFTVSTYLYDKRKNKSKKSGKGKP